MWRANRSIQVKVPLYVLASREDHIVPWQSAYHSKDLIGKDPRFVLAASGHVAGVINPPARNKRSHWLNNNLNCEAKDWIEGAEEKPGSWWPDWDAWLKRHSSGTVSAPHMRAMATIKSSKRRPVATSSKSQIEAMGQSLLLGWGGSSFGDRSGGKVANAALDLELRPD